MIMLKDTGADEADESDASRAYGEKVLCHSLYVGKGTRVEVKSATHLE
jgi:hypothetical protein